MSTDASIVTVVTQLTVREGCEDQFAAWRAEIGQIIASFPGFLNLTQLSPSPPA